MTPASLRAVADHLDGGAALPSVADLGRHYRALATIQSQRDRAWIDTPEDSSAKHAARLAFDQAETQALAVRSLILARPISTLADATALAVHGFLEADGVDNAVLCRAFARIAIVAGAAAGVSPGLFGSGDLTLELIKAHAGAEVAP
jgi:hypothetical protein